MRLRYISQLVEEKDLLAILAEEPGLGVEAIAFGIGDTLDQGPEAVQAYARQRERWPEPRPLSIHGPFLDLNPGSFDSLIREATLRRFRQAYQAAVELEAERIVFHTGFMPATCFEEGWPEQAAAFWKRFLEGTDGSVAVHLENVRDLHWQVPREILDRVDCPYFTACLDIGHLRAFSVQTPEEWIAGLGSRLGHLHLHDNGGEKDSHGALGEGNTDWGTVFQALERSCPQATATIENSQAGQIRKSLAFLRAQGGCF